ncbi:B-cell antigen receptor complex-associated protein beta chain isoform X2 [Brachyhypopomus gauderio]
MKCYALDYKLGKPQAMWHKAEKFTTNLKLKVNHPRATVASGMLTIKKVEIEDSGIYFCRINETWGLGTELQVFRHVDQRAAERRSTMKDLVIFIQTFLLMLLIALSLVKYNKLAKKEEAVYEEPEDHTYEGLEIENCGDLYEDIPAYSQYQRGEDIVESPDQE